MDHHLETYKHVIWDWNGTLLNDTDIVLEALNEQLSEAGFPSLDYERYRKIFGFPVQGFYERLGFDFEQHCFVTANTNFQKKYGRRLHRAKLHNGTKALLERTFKKAKTQTVLSAAEQTHLEDALRQFGIAHLFHHIFGQDNIEAKSKVKRGLELLRKLDAKPSQTILIGDTDHDLEVGEALGIDVLLVGDGHQCPTRLEQIHDFVIHNRH